MAFLIRFNESAHYTHHFLKKLYSQMPLRNVLLYNFIAIAIYFDNIIVQDVSEWHLPVIFIDNTLGLPVVILL